MNDFAFGNTIFDFRMRAGLSQAQLAEKLGVSDKAVSKWETGKSKPTTEVIGKLAVLFNVEVEQLLNLREKTVLPNVTKIVITGGPCAGKSTAMQSIKDAFTKLGYAVLFVSETATELITGGVAPWTLKSNAEYQKLQLKLQLEKEKIYEKAALSIESDKVLIVCDRGAMDNKAYMDEIEFLSVLNAINTNEVELRDGYDAVFHLATAAKGAEKFYTTANNSARTETPKEAIVLDDKLISVWTGHPHLRVIDNSTDFEGKMQRLIKEISVSLGEPEPLEIERKFLIEYPNISYLERNPFCKRVEIIQTYLKTANGDEIRVRQRGANGNYIYFRTVKRKISDIKREETETRISQAEYLKLLMDADTQKKQIRKTRYCLADNNRYFEIDVYPFWRDKAIAEIELSDETEKIVFPKNIKVIKEVTDDEAYKNATLADM